MGMFRGSPLPGGVPGVDALGVKLHRWDLLGCSIENIIRYPGRFGKTQSGRDVGATTSGRTCVSARLFDVSGGGNGVVRDQLADVQRGQVFVQEEETGLFQSAGEIDVLVE